MNIVLVREKELCPPKHITEVVVSHHRVFWQGAYLAKEYNYLKAN